VVTLTAMYYCYMLQQLDAVAAGGHFMERSRTMNPRVGLRIGATMLTFAVGLLVAPAPVFPDTQGNERREDRRDDRGGARDTRQTGRDDARDTKDACKDTDNSRAECRQDKRDVKQDARDTARDVKKE